MRDSEALRQLRRAMQGQINRLSEANIEPIASEIAALYRGNAAADCNAVLRDLVFTACSHETQVLRPLVMTFAALLAALHIIVGPGVGSFAIESATLEFARCAGLPLAVDAEARLARGAAPRVQHVAAAAAAGGSSSRATVAPEQPAKLQNNLLLLLTYLYVFNVAHPDLTANLLTLLAARFDETDLELLLLALVHGGFQLRSDDPAALKHVLAAVQARVKSAAPAAASGGAAASASATSVLLAAEGGAPSLASALGAAASAVPPTARMHVLADLVLDLKNNRRRTEHEQLLERGAQLRKWLSRLASRTAGVDGVDRRLRISWADLVQIPERGRWWLVGSSWVGRAAAGTSSAAADAAMLGGSGGDDAAAPDAGGSAADVALCALAQRMRMNTDIRRRVFVALMGADDADSALDRLLRLHLKGAAEREIVRVLVDCCAQEAAFNPFYAATAAALCTYNSRFKFTFQLAFWDVFKTFDDPELTTARRVYNLARLLSHLLCRGCQSFGALKPLDFTTAQPRTVLFLRAVFTAVLLDMKSQEELALVFTRYVLRCAWMGVTLFFCGLSWRWLRTAASTALALTCMLFPTLCPPACRRCVWVAASAPVRTAWRCATASSCSCTSTSAP
jgi:nucleolar MIF4G domain-containing protein 1